MIETLQTLVPAAQAMAASCLLDADASSPYGIATTFIDKVPPVLAAADFTDSITTWFLVP